MKKLLLLLSFLPLCIWGNEGMWLPWSMIICEMVL